MECRRRAISWVGSMRENLADTTVSGGFMEADVGKLGSS